MSSAFTALVELCRLARNKRIAGTDLILTVTQSADSTALLRQVESGNWTHTLRMQGVETTQQFDAIAAGAEVEIVIHGMTRTNQVIANNVGALLRLSQGQFLGAPPTEYFLIEENHASWETPQNVDVLSYLRAIRVVAFIRRLADVVLERRDTAGEAIIFASRKLVLPLTYDSTVLLRVAPSTDIDGLENSVFNEHHKEARIDIAKRVLIRFFDSVPELDRFSQLLNRVAEVQQSFLADLDLYVSGFSFDRAREEFERKKLDFVVKMNTASSDAMNKLIAIPVGQGLLVSQMKHDPGYEAVNAGLLVGSIVFALIAVALIVNQANTLLQIREELTTEKKVLLERAAPTYDRLKRMIAALDRRLNLHTYWVPTALALLLSVTTCMTVLAYRNVTSNAPPSADAAKRG